MAEARSVTEQDVLRVAELANLDLTAEEVPRMQRDLNAILGHVAQLNEVDTKGVPAMAQVGEMLGVEPELRTGRDAAHGRAAAIAGPQGGDGGGAGERWAILQGAEGD
jgi:aspartyl/glutamyl-tRNA(Asn/Gln) amidotransferase C subunit